MSQDLSSPSGPSSNSNNSSPANEFIKGFLWGFVAFVHVAAIMVLIFKMKMNCLPEHLVEALACTPPGSAKCPISCDPSNDFIFYILAGTTALAAVLFPLGFGIFFVAKSKEEACS